MFYKNKMYKLIDKELSEVKEIIENTNRIIEASGGIEIVSEALYLQREHYLGRKVALETLKQRMTFL